MNALAPSILSADFAALGEAVRLVENAGAPYIHVDVMDGHFVPNITIGAPVAAALRKHIKGIMDVHLMIENPDAYLEAFKDAGTDILTVHYESTPHIHRTLQTIRKLGMKSGLALNPGTPVQVIEGLIDEIDMVLIMSVNPGFGGQSFIPYALEKIKQVKALSEKVGKEILIQVDGGISLQNVEEVITAGANVIVAGSAVFGAQDVSGTVVEFMKRMNGSY